MRKPLSFSRRSLLRGLGAGGALMSGLVRTAFGQAVAQPTKVAIFYMGNGAHPDWAPSGTGTTFTLTPHLQGLEPIKSDVIIFRKLMAQRVTSINPHKGATLDLSSGGGATTFDQVMAAHVKSTAPTPVPSLELAIGRSSGGGGVVPSLSRVDNRFLPGIRNPLFLYDRVVGAMAPGTPMAGDPTGAATEKALAAKRSLLDFLREDVNLVRGRVVGQEKQRLDSYLDALRDMEGSLSGLGTQVRGGACTKGTPPKVAMDFEAHLSDLPQVSRMYMDIIAMSFACGATRVSSMMWGGGECNEPIGFMNVGAWHSTSHQNPTSGGQANLIKFHSWLATEWTYFVQQLKTMGLFDSTMTLWATQNGNSTESGFSKETHDRHNALFVLTGRANGYFKSLGKVVDCNDLNHNDLYLHMAHAFGMKVDTIGTAAWNKGPLPGVI
jgi:hypothetical protein